MPIAVITGVSSGIGLETTQVFLQNHYRVYGVSRNQPPIKHSNLIWIKADLSDLKKIDQIAQHIVENKIDILINNAGTATKQKTDDVTILNFQSQFELNFLAPILLAKHLQNRLKGGLIINVSSIFAQMSMSNYGLYCASKSALNSYFGVFAIEHPEIKVINIMPDAVDTPLLRRLIDADFPLDNAIKPQHIGQMLYNLSSDHAQFKSASQIIVINDKQIGDVPKRDKTWVYNTDSCSYSLRSKS